MHELVFVLVCVLASLCIELNSTARMSSVAVSIVSIPLARTTMTRCLFPKLA